MHNQAKMWLQVCPSIVNICNFHSSENFTPLHYFIEAKDQSTWFMWSNIFRVSLLTHTEYNLLNINNKVIRDPYIIVNG